MLFSILEVVVLSAHLLAVNVATAAPFVCVWCEWRAMRPGNEALRAVGRRLARDCVLLFLVGAALGLAELGWLFWRSDPADLEALRTMPTSRWWFGGLELLMYLGCMLAYWYGYDRWQSRGWQWLLAIAAGTNLGYHFPALFTIVSLVSERPELWGETINFRELLVDRETLARVAHFWFASFAVTGVLAMRPWRARAEEMEAPNAVPPLNDQRAMHFGARLALAATALQMPLGIWLLTTLPRASQNLVLGRSMLATGLLVAAVVTSLALMHLLASLALGDVEPRLVRRAALLIVAIVTMMVGTRVAVRHDLRQNSPSRRATHGPRGDLPEPPEPVTLLGGNQGGAGAFIANAREGHREFIQSHQRGADCMAVEEVVLKDESAGSQARVLAGYGFNCYSFQVQHAGQPTELLWAQPNFASGTQRASASGIPLLFPFAGRIGKGAFVYEGKKYDLEPGDGIGNGIHGFVLGVPWRVIEQSERKVIGEYHAGRDNPAVLARWPADFRIRVSYELRGDALLSKITIDNPGDGPLPFWFGTHPYFRVPPLGGDHAAGCIVRVPAGTRWPLENMLPTGKTESGGAAAQLSAGAPFADTRLDDVFGDLTFKAGKCRTAIEDPTTHRAVEMTFGPEFPACVVYNPPHREAICIEPYTAVPDAFALESRGIAAGLRVLKPGESFQGQIDIAVVPVK